MKDPTNLYVCSWPISVLRSYPRGFGLQIAKMMPSMVSEGKSQMLATQASVLDPKAIFQSMEFKEPGQQADLVSVVRYLRGSKLLRIPEDWRPLCRCGRGQLQQDNTNL